MGRDRRSERALPRPREGQVPLAGFFEGVDQLLKLRLVGSHSLGWTRKFNEHVSTWTLDNRTQETVAGHAGGRRGCRPCHARVLAGYVNRRHRQTMNGNFG